MKKRIYLLFLLALALVFMTSCQQIEEAIEDTFRPVGKNKTLPDDKKGSFFWEDKIEFSQFEIEDDIIYKLGMEDPDVKFSAYIYDYIGKNGIRDYFTQEEAEAILASYNKLFLRINPDEVIKAFKKLEKEFAGEEIYIENASISINENSINLSVHLPDNPKHIDYYFYYAKEGVWKTQPKKTIEKENPLENSYLLSELPLDSLHKVVEKSFQILKEIGAYNEEVFYENADPFKGITDLDMRDDRDHGFIFRVTISGDRERIVVIFDKDGNIIEEKR